jgi:hypothetical protein
LVIGTNVEAWSANLDSWSALAPAVKADLASPTFTGVPAAPTAAGGTNTTQIATTAFVQSALGAGLPALADGKFWVGNGSAVATAVTPTGDVTFTNAGVFAIGSAKVLSAMIQSSVALAGSPTTTTQATADASTKIATTAYVDRGSSGTTSAWTAYTPLYYQNSTVAKTVTSARFKLIGKTMHVEVDMTTTATGTATVAVLITLPTITDSPNGAVPIQNRQYYSPLGFGVTSLNGAFSTVTAIFDQTTAGITYVRLYIPSTVTVGSGTGWTAALAVGDVAVLNFTYEVA